MDGTMLKDKKIHNLPIIFPGHTKQPFRIHQALLWAGEGRSYHLSTDTKPLIIYGCHCCCILIFLLQTVAF